MSGHDTDASGYEKALVEAINSLASRKTIRRLMSRVRLRHGATAGQLYLAIYASPDALWGAMCGKPQLMKRLVCPDYDDFAERGPPEPAQLAREMDRTCEILVAIGFESRTDPETAMICFAGVFPCQQQG